MPRQHLHACWCAREEEVLPVVVHVNEDIICFLFFLCCLFVCLFLSLSFSLQQSNPNGGEEKKIQKQRKVGTHHIPLQKIYLKRAGREHTHTHTRKEEEEEFKKLKKKLKKKKKKRVSLSNRQTVSRRFGTKKSLSFLSRSPTRKFTTRKQLKTLENENHHPLHFRTKKRERERRVKKTKKTKTHHHHQESRFGFALVIFSFSCCLLYFYSKKKKI